MPNASRQEFGVKDKKCVCRGLNQVLEMTEFYRDYATGVKHVPHTPETNKKALGIVRNMLNTLKPEDASGERGKEWLQKAKTEALACEREGEGCMMALEWVRAAIHEDMGLDAKLTCQKYRTGLGSDFVEQQPWNDIRWAMYGLAHFGRLTEKDAVDTLKKSMRKNKCP